MLTYDLASVYCLRGKLFFPVAYCGHQAIQSIQFIQQMPGRLAMPQSGPAAVGVSLTGWGGACAGLGAPLAPRAALRLGAPPLRLCTLALLLGGAAAGCPAGGFGALRIHRWPRKVQCGRGGRIGVNVDHWVSLTQNIDYQYYYYDNNTHDFIKSLFLTNQTKNGCIMNTMNQLYNNIN
jgi:hypothetical protein